MQVVDRTPSGEPDRGPTTPIRPVLLVSSCLLGEPCNYKGLDSHHAGVAALADGYELVPVCPEVAGGLPVPRPRAEISADGKVRTEAGEDLTVAYEHGAGIAVALAQTHRAVAAVLKARSPSCGSREVYDGTFTSTLVSGDGVTAAALRRAGFPVISEEDLAEGCRPEAG